MKYTTNPPIRALVITRNTSSVRWAPADAKMVSHSSKASANSKKRAIATKYTMHRRIYARAIIQNTSLAQLVLAHAKMAMSSSVTNANSRRLAMPKKKRITVPPIRVLAMPKRIGAAP